MKKQWIGWLKFVFVFVLLVCAAQFSLRVSTIFDKSQFYAGHKLLCMFLVGILLSSGKRKEAFHPSFFLALLIMALMMVNMFIVVIPGISRLVNLFLSMDGSLSGMALFAGLLLGWLVPAGKNE